MRTLWKPSASSSSCRLLIRLPGTLCSPTSTWRPQELTVGEETTTIASDIPDILAEAGGIAPSRPPSPARPKALRAHPYMRLETFDVDMPRKQEAYGFPSDLVGSYGFGAFFGTSQHWVNGVSQGTNFNDTC